MTTEQGAGGSPRVPYERAPQVDFVELGVQDAQSVLKEYKTANSSSSEDVVKEKARNGYTPIIKQKIRRKEVDGKEVRESIETFETFTPEARSGERTSVSQGAPVTILLIL